jgi:hypothetical protein
LSFSEAPGGGGAPGAILTASPELPRIRKNPTAPSARTMATMLTISSVRCRESIYELLELPVEVQQVAVGLTGGGAGADGRIGPGQGHQLTAAKRLHMAVGEPEVCQLEVRPHCDLRRRITQPGGCDELWPAI